MGQCVTKCKNPTSSLGSKSGDSKSHHKKGGGGGHKEEPSGLCSKATSELSNGTKALEVTVEMPVIAAVMGETRKDERLDRDGLSMLRIDELFHCYKDGEEDAILEEGMEMFCNDLCVDPAEFRVLVLAWKFQAATMCKFTRYDRVLGNGGVLLLVSVHQDERALLLHSYWVSERTAQDWYFLIPDD